MPFLREAELKVKGDIEDNSKLFFHNENISCDLSLQEGPNNGPKICFHGENMHSYP